MLRIARSDMKEIYAQALKEYPAECCGVLTEHGSVSAIHVCENIQQAMHDKDRKSFPRDARTAYIIAPKVLSGIAAEAESSGGRVSGYYHSHIDCPAYFSEEDERRTWIFNSRAEGEEPDDPDAIYLVISVCGEEFETEDMVSKREVKDYKCFTWDGSAYAETGLEIVD